MKRLVIAEKPSVAMSIAAVLGVNGRKDGYMEGADTIVSWCVGHLAALAGPEAYSEKFTKWDRADLPIIPAEWRYRVPRDKHTQFEVLRRLMGREDVSEVVNACDAGREGELIFRNVYAEAGCTKPVLRLWISSMEDSAIVEGFNALRPGVEYDDLFAAARCREWADWLVGINATRLFSVVYHRTLKVGRVMSPTLAMLVEREAQISAFTPEKFYTVELDLGGFTAESERFTRKGDADALLRNAACLTNSRAAKGGCSGVLIYEDDLLASLMTVLVETMDTVLGQYKLSLADDQRSAERIAALKDRTAWLDRELNKMQMFSGSLYENLVQGVLDTTEYLRLKETYTQKADALTAELETVSSELQVLKEKSEKMMSLARDAREIRKNRRLTSELIHRLIERVEVSHDKQITVTYTFVTDYEHYKEALERCADM